MIVFSTVVEQNKNGSWRCFKLNKRILETREGKFAERFFSTFPLSRLRKRSVSLLFGNTSCSLRFFVDMTIKSCSCTLAKKQFVTVVQTLLRTLQYFAGPCINPKLHEPVHSMGSGRRAKFSPTGNNYALDLWSRTNKQTTIRVSLVRRCCTQSLTNNRRSWLKKFGAIALIIVLPVSENNWWRRDITNKVPYLYVYSSYRYSQGTLPYSATFPALRLTF